MGGQNYMGFRGELIVLVCVLEVSVSFWGNMNTLLDVNYYTTEKL